MMWKRRKTTEQPPAPAEPFRRVATPEETAARLATLTVSERELLEWGKQQEPMTIRFCFRGPYVVGVDLSLDLFNLQQHIEQFVEPVDDASGTAPEMCTHLGTGTPFASRLNTLLADLRRPGGERWTAAALATEMIGQGEPVRPDFVAGLCSGIRTRPHRSFVALLARVLVVPVSYFDGRAVRLSTDTATGRQVVVEEPSNSAGRPNPRPVPAL
jgi:hypothetical protein